MEQTASVNPFFCFNALKNGQILKGGGGLIEKYNLDHLEHMIVLFGRAIVAEISIFYFETNWLLTSLSGNGVGGLNTILYAKQTYTSVQVNFIGKVSSK